MKSASWKKESVVIALDDYNNTWLVKTVPMTRLQAIKFVIAKHWENALDRGVVKIVNIGELDAILN